MTNNEKKLFIDLCKFKEGGASQAIKDNINNGMDTSAVLGELFFNRMTAVAYKTLQSNMLLSQVNREFRTALKNAYLQNKEKNQSYFDCVQELGKILQPLSDKYAMLKGAYLCRAYPEGLRVSNDIDLLVRAKDVSLMGKVLLDAGFRQGRIQNDIFTPATRLEIISSKMLRGETVAYIKEVNLPYMKYMEVDINFSLDYKNGDEQTVGKMIDESRRVAIDDMELITLNQQDFFIHLCEHLYKEATAYFWVKAKRDMSLYKYCDLYMLLAEMTEECLQLLIRRTKELDCINACYYAVFSTKHLFNMDTKIVDKLLESIKPKHTDYINKVVDPYSKKMYEYTEHNILKRFWHPNRKNILVEVKNDNWKT